MGIDYGLDKQGRILSINYTGIITFKDLEENWISVINQNLIHENIRGFILDCRNAIMEIELAEISKLSGFFKRNITVFEKKRFAYVTQSPEQIILPLLLQEDDYNYESRPFSTTRAAIEWVLN